MPLRAIDVLEVPHRLVMGLSAVRRDADWLVVDGRLASDLREKRRLLVDEREQVRAVAPGSGPAQRETLALLARHLSRYHSAHYRFDAGRVTIAGMDESVSLDPAPEDALEHAALLVQEDLVLLEPTEQGWRLTAAIVCFPTRWDLPSKLGRPLAAIHEPVPGYAGALERSADRFFDGLEPGRAFRRGNWSLLDDPTLFQPRGPARTGPDPSLHAGNAGERVLLRREHQTLRRLPESRAVLFTIRILQEPLARLARDPATARALAASIRSMDEGLRRYKSLGVVQDAALAWIDAHLGPA